MHDDIGTSSTRSPAGQGIESFGYFMLQVHRAVLEGQPALQLILEDLGTQDKRAFASSAELGRFLDAWSGLPRDDSRFQPPERTP